MWALGVVSIVLLVLCTLYFAHVHVRGTATHDTDTSDDEMDRTGESTADGRSRNVAAPTTSQTLQIAHPLRNTPVVHPPGPPAKQPRVQSPSEKERGGTGSAEDSAHQHTSPSSMDTFVPPQKLTRGGELQVQELGVRFSALSPHDTTHGKQDGPKMPTQPATPKSLAQAGKHIPITHTQSSVSSTETALTRPNDPPDRLGGSHSTLTGGGMPSSNTRAPHPPNAAAVPALAGASSLQSVPLHGNGVVKPEIGTNVTSQNAGQTTPTLVSSGRPNIVPASPLHTGEGSDVHAPRKEAEKVVDAVPQALPGEAKVPTPMPYGSPTGAYVPIFAPHAPQEGADAAGAVAPRVPSDVAAAPALHASPTAVVAAGDPPPPRTAASGARPGLVLAHAHVPPETNPVVAGTGFAANLLDGTPNIINTHSEDVLPACSPDPSANRTTRGEHLTSAISPMHGIRQYPNVLPVSAKHPRMCAEDWLRSRVTSTSMPYQFGPAITFETSFARILTQRGKVPGWAAGSGQPRKSEPGWIEDDERSQMVYIGGDRGGGMRVPVIAFEAGLRSITGSTQKFVTFYGPMTSVKMNPSDVLFWPVELMFTPDEQSFSAARFVYEIGTSFVSPVDNGSELSRLLSFTHNLSKFARTVPGLYFARFLWIFLIRMSDMPQAYHEHNIADKLLNAMTTKVNTYEVFAQNLGRSNLLGAGVVSKLFPYVRATLMRWHVDNPYNLAYTDIRLRHDQPMGAYVPKFHADSGFTLLNSDHAAAFLIVALSSLMYDGPCIPCASPNAHVFKMSIQLLGAEPLVLGRVLADDGTLLSPGKYKCDKLEKMMTYLTMMDLQDEDLTGDVVEIARGGEGVIPRRPPKMVRAPWLPIADGPQILGRGNIAVADQVAVFPSIPAGKVLPLLPTVSTMLPVMSTVFTGDEQNPAVFRSGVSSLDFDVLRGSSDACEMYYKILDELLATRGDYPVVSRYDEKDRDEIKRLLSIPINAYILKNIISRVRSTGVKWVKRWLGFSEHAYGLQPPITTPLTIPHEWFKSCYPMALANGTPGTYVGAVVNLCLENKLGWMLMCLFLHLGERPSDDMSFGVEELQKYFAHPPGTPLADRMPALTDVFKSVYCRTMMLCLVERRISAPHGGGKTGR